MNNEMMPLMMFLLQTEDLKKQSDRIIQELKSGTSSTEAAAALSNAGENFLNQITNSISSLTGKVHELHEKIDQLADKLKEPAHMQAN
jgi:cell division septum initiation protein DivIVA